jgi:hypothetical protein
MCPQAEPLAAPCGVPMRSSFGPQICPRLKSSLPWGKKTGSRAAT